MKHYDSVDAFLDDANRWRDESAALREVLLDCGLEEAIKWGKPCYGHGGANIAIVQPFKDFLALMFFKGILLDAPDGVLEEQGENTHAARRLCFRSTGEVAELDATLRDLVDQAIAVETAGTPLPDRPADTLAAELQDALDADPALASAFAGLTPGRQREYNLHISGAKQSKTRAARVGKLAPRILAGMGLRDR